MAASTVESTGKFIVQDIGFAPKEGMLKGSLFIVGPSGIAISTSRARLRASFTNRNGGFINSFTGRPSPPPGGLDSISRRQFVRENSHLELTP